MNHSPLAGLDAQLDSNFFYLHVVNMIQSMSFKCHIRSQVINFCQSKMNKTVPKIQI